jgi:hypothetical protein
MSLLGGKNDRTSLAVLEYYKDHQKLFLNQLYEKIKGDQKVSSDLILLDQINSFVPDIKLLAVDVPLTLPLCLVCRPKCPGIEKCKEAHVQWMWKNYESRLNKKKTTKMFTPYTQRCVEMYLASELEEAFHLQEALGANMAPLTARLQYLKLRLKIPMIEIYPQLSLWRIGRSLGLSKKYLLPQGRSLDQDTTRQMFLQALVEKRLVFIYQQDIQRLIDNKDVFNAFLAALTGYLSSRGQCEPRPRSFPPLESWLEFPVEQPLWF